MSDVFDSAEYKIFIKNYLLLYAYLNQLWTQNLNQIIHYDCM